MSTLSLVMLLSWAFGTPDTDLGIWKNLLPVAVAHTVETTVSMSKVAVSFTSIIKSGEPTFSVLVSRFFLGETFPSTATTLAAATELNFNLIGFMGAMVSKKGMMKEKSVGGMNYSACLSFLNAHSNA